MTLLSITFPLAGNTWQNLYKACAVDVLQAVTGTLSVVHACCGTMTLIERTNDNESWRKQEKGSLQNYFHSPDCFKFSRTEVFRMWLPSCVWHILFFPIRPRLLDFLPIGVSCLFLLRLILFASALNLLIPLLQRKLSRILTIFYVSFFLLWATLQMRNFSKKKYSYFWIHLAQRSASFLIPSKKKERFLVDGDASHSPLCYLIIIRDDVSEFFWGVQREINRKTPAEL